MLVQSTLTDPVQCHFQCHGTARDRGCSQRLSKDGPATSIKYVESGEQVAMARLILERTRSVVWPTGLSDIGAIIHRKRLTVTVGN